MTKWKFHWDPDVLSTMSTEAIVAKMKELVPDFTLDSFVAIIPNYISSEDMSEKEYYPRAAFSDKDEDFIWLACDELWKRLMPDRPALEHISDKLDSIVDEMDSAEEKRQWRKVQSRSKEALDLICLHTIEQTASGRRLKRDVFEKLSDLTIFDLDSLLEDLLLDLMGDGEYKQAIDIAGIFGEGLGDDTLLEYRAESLFALGKRDEGEQLYQDIIRRNPDDSWYLLKAGDCYVKYGKKDFAKARSYYLKALKVAENNRNTQEGRDDLRAVYRKLIELSNNTSDHAQAARYTRLLDASRAEKVGRNDPCPCGSGKKYKKCCGGGATPVPEPPSFDRRTMERDLLALRQLAEEIKFTSMEDLNRHLEQLRQTGEIPRWTPRTPLEKAQSLIFEALETGGSRRMELVEQALKTSPDCTDAYVLLAEERAGSLEEAASLYEAGVKAAVRTLGEKFFEEEAGHFWGMVETRPYMRARLGLAQCLCSQGKREEAIGHYRDLLRFNPDDNQGVRYLLAATLLDLGKVEEVEELLGKYDEPTAAWLFTRALVAYAREGDSSEAHKLLREALDCNPFVAPYILGDKKLPGKIPDRVGFGDKDEAVAYAADFGSGWRGTKGAIEWLRAALPRPTPKERRGKDKLPGVPDAYIKAFEPEDKKT